MTLSLAEPREITRASSVQARRNGALQRVQQSLNGPCNLLVVGQDVSQAIQRLNAQGHKADNLLPRQFERSAFDDASRMPSEPVDSSFQTLQGKDGHYDVVIFFECGGSIDLLNLFSKCSTLLRPSAKIFLIDTFSLKFSDHRLNEYYFLNHVIALGARFGFEASFWGSPDDSGDSASQNLPDEKPAGSEDRSEESELVYEALRLCRSELPRWTIRWMQSNHIEQMRTLFKKAFGQEMPSQLWQWKYGHDQARAVGVWEGDRLVAHYGGFTRDVLYLGKPRRVAQSGDVMADLLVRKALGRGSPFFIATATYLECSIGFGKPHLLGVGFPNLRHLRAAALLGLYGGPVSKVLELQWSCKVLSLKQLLLKIRRIEIHRQSDRDVINCCWQEMSRYTQQFIVGVRDAKWLRYRYVEHPIHRYEIFSINLGVFGLSYCLGILVLREHPENELEIVDMVSSPAKIKWLVLAARLVASQKKLNRVYAWTTDSIENFFKPYSSHTDLQIGVPTNRWTPGPSDEQLRSRWWLMGGDTDFR